MRRVFALFVVLIVIGAAYAMQRNKSNAMATVPHKRVIQPANYKPTASPLSPAILIGDTLYMSGATGGDPTTGQLVQGGFEPEMRQIMSNLQTVLKTADMDLTNVVAVTTYLRDMSDFARFNEIYRE